MDSAIVVAVISLIGVIFTAIWTKNSFSQELDKKVAILDTKMENMDEHIREHNHYAKLFQENIPVIQEKLKVCEHRIGDLENEIKR